MGYRLKIGSMIAGLTLGMCAFAGSAVAGNPLEDLVNKVQSDFKAINDKGEQDRARIRGEAQAGNGAQAGDMTLAARPEASQSKPVQLIIPRDKKVAAVVEEALPNIKKVLGIHQCVKEAGSLRQLNFYTVSGVDVMKIGMLPYYNFPNSEAYMKYHDRNKCVSVTTIDQWTMPALNALLFRAVYFADDSGETVNFLYLFKRVDDGSWKLAQLEKN